MKIRVDIRNYGLENVRIIITIDDTEEIFSNKLFKNSLDYPSDISWVFIENKDNINWVENVFYEEKKATLWANNEIKCLKDKLNI